MQKNQKTKPKKQKTLVAKNIYIFDDITNDTALDIISGLNSIDFTTENINALKININTNGGSLMDCFAIIDCVEKIKYQYNLFIITEGWGSVVSAGFFLFLLGDERILNKSALIYVHEHITTQPVDVTYSKKVQEDRIEKHLNDMYCDWVGTRLGIQKQKARELLKLDKWLDGETIAEFGITTQETDEQAWNFRLSK